MSTIITADEVRIGDRITVLHETPWQTREGETGIVIGITGYCAEDWPIGQFTFDLWTWDGYTDDYTWEVSDVILHPKIGS